MIDTKIINRSKILYMLLKNGIDVTDLCIVGEHKKDSMIELLISLLNYNCSLLNGFGAPESEKADTDVICIKNLFNISENGTLVKYKPIFSIWNNPGSKKNEICMLTHGVISESLGS